MLTLDPKGYQAELKAALHKIATGKTMHFAAGVGSSAANHRFLFDPVQQPSKLKAAIADAAHAGTFPAPQKYAVGEASLDPEDPASADYSPEAAGKA